MLTTTRLLALERSQHADAHEGPRPGAPGCGDALGCSGAVVSCEQRREGKAKRVKGWIMKTGRVECGETCVVWHGVVVAVVVVVMIMRFQGHSDDNNTVSVMVMVVWRGY